MYWLTFHRDGIGRVAQRPCPWRNQEEALGDAIDSLRAQEGDFARLWDERRDTAEPQLHLVLEVRLPR